MTELQCCNKQTIKTRCALTFSRYLIVYTVFTRLSAAALFKFSEHQMRRSIGSGAQSGAALKRINTVCFLFCIRGFTLFKGDLLGPFITSNFLEVLAQ